MNNILCEASNICAIVTQLLQLLNEVGTMNSLILQMREWVTEMLSNFSNILQLMFGGAGLGSKVSVVARHRSRLLVSYSSEREKNGHLAHSKTSSH